MWWSIVGKPLLRELHPVTAGATGSGPAPPISSHPSEGELRQGDLFPMPALTQGWAGGFLVSRL